MCFKCYITTDRREVSEFRALRKWSRLPDEEPIVFVFLLSLSTHFSSGSPNTNPPVGSSIRFIIFFNENKTKTIFVKISLNTQRVQSKKNVVLLFSFSFVFSVSKMPVVKAFRRSSIGRFFCGFDGTASALIDECD